MHRRSRFAILIALLAACLLLAAGSAMARSVLWATGEPELVQAEDVVDLGGAQLAIASVTRYSETSMQIRRHARKAAGECRGSQTFCPPEAVTRFRAGSQPNRKQSSRKGYA